MSGLPLRSLRTSHLHVCRHLAVLFFIEQLNNVKGFGPEVISQLLRKPDPGLASLTRRERDVLGVMAEGKSNSGIAAKLMLSEGAVEKHIASIFGKLALEPESAVNRRFLAVLRYLRT
jgi:DNA-binding NarL/FixJ family response regulator